ncbi:hypothetical protein B0T11DRAFT_359968 [Plectosphaerella cucumerina]|uniref:Uncharacterized protein n=1 Tax=Plectosphaerella cucumerina TaxID=40658 RepID=A0A8K0T8N9_9PEZI|nr:hypothetical protein B0T11DRAFT_359968 [Plectosphaerella cucumerina]
MPPYTLSAPIDCNVDFETHHLAGKTAVVTGGASGIGEAYVRALDAAGLTVVIGDRDAKRGEALAAELKSSKFVQCDVTNWEDQVRLFKTAKEASPSGKIQFVVANAGITREDDVFSFDADGPKKPDLSIIQVNLHGTLYTTKLAHHYFTLQNGTQPSPNQEDSCLILVGSGAAFLDCPRTPQYCSTKWGNRGIMHALRRTAYFNGSRVNVISPWYVRTSILPQELFDKVERSGVEFATTEDAGQCLLRILSDPSVNGRSLFLSPRKWAPRGYLDLDLDDYAGNELLQEIQADQIRDTPVELGLYP